MRRLQAKEEERAKKRRSGAPRSQKKGGKEEQLNIFQRIRKYLREVRSELNKVNWPSQQELRTYTIVVFSVTTVLTLIVFAMDWAFSRLVINFLDAII
ncbi:MAG: preprotein translocase subunit SecE [Acidimicrobiia bacterium]|nr:preprotein translocase subunit SecE [Acidimicrobiia bacterium]